MKKFQLLLVVLFIGFIAFMFLKQSARKKKLFGEYVYGEVVTAGIGNKGYYHLTFIQDNKLRELGYIPGEDGLIAVNGDSVYKERNSDIFYIRKNEKPDFIKTGWKDCHISGKWEE